jgi:hypothetical protein
LENLKERTFCGTSYCRNNNEKMDFKEIWSDNMNWIQLAEDTSQWWDLVYLVLYHPILYKARNDLTS